MVAIQVTNGTGDPVPKAPTGIQGLDEITEGGLPRGRATLACGGPGCGKTILAVQFLVHGIACCGEGGVFVSFEEPPKELAENIRGTGVDLDALVEEKRLFIDHIDEEAARPTEMGEYDLGGFFARLDYAVSLVEARRVVIDGLETLFSRLSRADVLRSELRRLFRHLKQQGITLLVTAESGRDEGSITRSGIEEYVSDCVIVLGQRIHEQVSTRRLRILKYRGSSHGTNEYPFLIDRSGFSVLPITSMSLEHGVPHERIGTGLVGLDRILGGRGFFRGSSILVSGTAGTGKSTLAAFFAAEVCGRGERCLYFAFEESERQIVRNMQSCGLDLDPLISGGLLSIQAVRPTRQGLEMHLVSMYRKVRESAPDAVVIDPISNLESAGTVSDSKQLLLRVLDHLKAGGVTAVCTDLTKGDKDVELTEVGISSIMDTWVLLRNDEDGELGRRVRTLRVVKSRGMRHSDRVFGFHITDRGVELDEDASHKTPEGTT